MARSLSKSPVAVARQAMRTARQALAPYSNKFSRRDFSQHQLFAILVLRQFFKTDYRGICTLLEELGELREALDLKKVPHYSTLCVAEQRLLKKGAWTR